MINIKFELSNYFSKEVNMTTLNATKVIIQIGRIEEIIKEIKKVKPHLSDEEVLKIVLHMLN